ncbi:YeeE/YedE family integral membrane protein-like protein [Amniculicola lignicola CBS 123094]|uniref:YeeE/YedE family integral membrane protein-like protein n=1 Tax=Amniculicola lignicola CBS 123094 TaxID=1392246 RepID=A0A6A5WBL7_9PLEO|nr:YeeE/YedE family integral membrane protein-like protein [Amniculicola lignicola CBS 123094]
MFTPIETSIGAFLLHQGSSTLLFQNGAVMGASGYMRKIVSSPTRGTLAFFAGMALSFLPLKVFLPELATVYPPVPTTWPAAIVTAVVGALVGWGTKAGSGCTSGHMLCGLARLSGWSAVAVATFFPVAMITHHLVHPSLRTEVCASDVPCYTPTYPSRATTISLLILAATTALAARIIPRLVANCTKEEGKQNGESPGRQATELFAGLEFGLGLHISQMASPAKVLAFLSFPNMKLWDPSMMLVILFGIVPSLIEIQARGYNKPPRFNSKFDLPSQTLKDVDWKFVLGAAVFGVGWGLTGTCPGPAILRAYAQPTWGMLWLGGFWLGGEMVPSAYHHVTGAC